MKKFVLATALALSAFTATAADHLVTHSGNYTYYQSGPIGDSYSNGHVINIWVKQTNDRDPKEITMVLQQIHCASNQTRVIQGASYYNGQLINSSNVEEPWEYIIPGSVGVKFKALGC
jgi:hypothetical protein